MVGSTTKMGHWLLSIAVTEASLENALLLFVPCLNRLELSVEAPSRSKRILVRGKSGYTLLCTSDAPQITVKGFPKSMPAREVEASLALALREAGVQQHVLT